MAKQITERRMALVFELTKEGGNPVEVVCRADYEVTSEDLVVSRSFSPILSVAQETAIKGFATNILAQIKALEGVI